jgi:hypothetical protein
VQGDCYVVSGCSLRPIDDFLPEVMIAAPQVPEEIVANYVRQAAIEFCQRTHVFKQTLPVNLQACVHEILLDAECDMQIVSIRALCPSRDTTPMQNEQHDDYSTAYQNPHQYMGKGGGGGQTYQGSYTLVPERPCQLSCNGTSVWFTPPGTLTVPIPPKRDHEGAMFALVSVAPKEEACELPESLYQRYRRYITAGALAEIHQLKTSGVYDLALSKEKRRQFDAGVTGASIERLLGYGTGPIRIKPRMRVL